MRRAFWMVLAFGCSGPTKPPPGDPGPGSAAVVVDAEPAPAQPLRLAGDTTPPGWLEPELPDGIDPFQFETTEAYGLHAGLVKTRTQYFALDERHGALGPLAVPAGAVWVGLGGATDQVFAAMEDGTLYRADDPRAALTTFVQVGRVPGAVEWTASAKLVAAAVGGKVFVSTDGGKKFKSVTVDKRRPIGNLLSRSDGVILANAHSTDDAEDVVTYVSKGGGSWKKSSLQVFYPRQEGDWILTDCDGAVMAKGSLDWVERPDEPQLWKPEVRYEATTWWLDDGDRMWTTTHPAPPADDKAKRVKGRGSPCMIDILGGGGLGYRAERMCNEPFSCAARLHGALPALSQTVLQVIADGVRDDDGKVTRAPHLLHVDRTAGTARVIDAPAGCVPAAVYYARGLSLVACDPKDGTTPLHALAADGWHPEGVIATAPETLREITLAEDGTAMINTSCETCAPWLRTPDGGAWAKAAIPEDTEIVRAAPGGRAVALVHAADGSYAVVLVTPGAADEILLTGVQIPHTDSVEIVGGELVFDGKARLYTDGKLR